MKIGGKTIIALTAASLLLPVFRSGGRDNLNFWEWVLNHTNWGPPIEYIPEEDYKKAFGISVEDRK